MKQTYEVAALCVGETSAPLTVLLCFMRVKRVGVRARERLCAESLPGEVPCAVVAPCDAETLALFATFLCSKELCERSCGLDKGYAPTKRSQSCRVRCAETSRRLTPVRRPRCLAPFSHDRRYTLLRVCVLNRAQAARECIGCPSVGPSIDEVVDVTF